MLRYVLAGGSAYGNSAIELYLHAHHASKSMCSAFPGVSPLGQSATVGAICLMPPSPGELLYPAIDHKNAFSEFGQLYQQAKEEVGRS